MVLRAVCQQKSTIPQGKTYFPREEIDEIRRACYAEIGAVAHGRRLTSYPRGEEVMQMVTYEGLFAFCMVIIGIISLLQKKK